MGSSAGVVSCSGVDEVPPYSDLEASCNISIGSCNFRPRWLNVVRKEGFTGFHKMRFGLLIILSRSNSDACARVMRLLGAFDILLSK